MGKEFNVSAAAKNLKKKQITENKQMEELRSEAQKFGLEAARLMGKSDPSLEKVIGFGSTYETWRGYRVDSDIDLGIIGGDVGMLENMFSESKFRISLIELVDQSDNFKDLVYKNSVVLYEK